MEMIGKPQKNIRGRSQKEKNKRIKKRNSKAGHIPLTSR